MSLQVDFTTSTCARTIADVGAAGVRDGTRWGTEQGWKELPLLFFSGLPPVGAAWLAGLPPSTVRHVSMALQDVPAAILSAETVPRLKTASQDPFLYSRRVIGWAMSPRQSLSVVAEAWWTAWQRRRLLPQGSCIVAMKAIRIAPQPSIEDWAQPVEQARRLAGSSSGSSAGFPVLY